MRMWEAFFAMRRSARLLLVSLRGILQRPELNAGKISVITVLGSTIAIAVFIAFFEAHVQRAIAAPDIVSTSVTVLNTPPQWVEDAQETPPSASTSPTSIGSAVTWTGRAVDSNNESYYLLICKTSGTPTANSGAAPTCNGGISNQWNVSSLTASNATATAATTTTETWVFASEHYDWWGWVCDANASLPRCNAASRQGAYPYESPFVVNHRPYFTNITNDGPEDPGGTVTWSSTAFDNDATGTADTVTLVVCKTNDFTGSYCGPGGTWATSTAVTTNAATTTPIAIPSQDKTYDAYVYMYDNHGLVASTSFHGFNSTFVVNNVAPTTTQSSITLIDSYSSSNPVPGGDLNLWNAVSTSGPYRVHFTAVDNNSCQADGGGAELTFAVTGVYRSGIGQTGCDDASEYNSNYCYAASSTLFAAGVPNMTGARGMSCAATTTGAGACGGATDTTVDWECTFPLWYNADPTDGSLASDTPHFNQNWLASVRVQDDDSASSTFQESTIVAGSQPNVASFVAFDVSSTTIPYGGIEPGNSTTSVPTDLITQGNTGLDETIYGDSMCTTWTVFDSCDNGGQNPASEIPATTSQKIATSSVAWSHAEMYFVGASTTPRGFQIRVPKTTATASPQTKYNYWNIQIPSAITLAGSYSGQMVVTGISSNAAFW